MIRYIKHTHTHFFSLYLIGLCDIKVCLIKLKNFPQSFHNVFVQASVVSITVIVAVTCNVCMLAGKESVVIKKSSIEMNGMERGDVTNDANLFLLVGRVPRVLLMGIHHEHPHQFLY